MCAECSEQETSRPPHPLPRRSFLKASAAITAMAFVGAGALSGTAHADALTMAQRDKLSPDEVLALMKKGNKRFYSGKREDRNVLAQQRASAKGQYPAAVLLTCIDSRAPAETIMDLRIGDIFNARVAGNVENPDILGSMEFACKLAGSKVVLVMVILRAARLRAQLTTPNSAISRACWRKSSPRSPRRRTVAKGPRRITLLLTPSPGRMWKLRWPTFARTVLCWPQWSPMALSKSPVRCTMWRQA
jgi:hypothetical protein